MMDRVAGHEIARHENVGPSSMAVFYFNVLQFHALLFGPSFSRPAFSPLWILLVRHFHVLHFQSPRTGKLKSGIRYAYMCGGVTWECLQVKADMVLLAGNTV